MNRLIYLLFFSFTMTTGSLYGQFTMKAGLNVSSQYTNNKAVGNQSANIGYQAGIAYGLPVSERFLIQPELYYTHKGAKYDAFQFMVDANMDYIEFPLLVVFQPSLAKAIRFHIGPQLSYLTRVKFEYTSELTGVEKEANTDRDQFNKWDVGAAAGMGLYFERFFTELRYTQGFREIEKPVETGGIEFENTNLKNFSLQVSAGIIF